MALGATATGSVGYVGLIRTPPHFIELERQADLEINEWSKLVDQFQAELDRFQLVCCFCGVMLDPQVLNGTCAMNGEEAHPLVPTTPPPPQDCIGTERHYFAKSE